MKEKKTRNHSTEAADLPAPITSYVMCCCKKKKAPPPPLPTVARCHCYIDEQGALSSVFFIVEWDDAGLIRPLFQCGDCQYFLVLLSLLAVPLHIMHAIMLRGRVDTCRKIWRHAHGWGGGKSRWTEVTRSHVCGITARPGRAGQGRPRGKSSPVFCIDARFFVSERARARARERGRGPKVVKDQQMPQLQIIYMRKTTPPPNQT